MVTRTTATATLAASPLVWALEAVRLPGPRGAEPFRPYPYQAVLLGLFAWARARETGPLPRGLLESAMAIMIAK